MQPGIARRWALPLAATAVLLAMVGIVAVAVAEDPDLGAAAAASTPVSNVFSYAGYLEMDGAAAAGTYDFRFSIYDSESGGLVVGTVQAVDDLAVEGGIFAADLTCGGPQGAFDGSPRWLQVEVREGSSTGAYTVLPRQALTATPYAWSLRAGALITGGLASQPANSAIVSVRVLDTAPQGVGVYAATYATGDAVKAFSPGGAGLYGDTDTGYGVYGYAGGASNSGRGFGGYFYSSGGVGVYGQSAASPTAQNAYMPGVLGRSTNGVGVYGVSEGSGSNAAAIRAQSATANLIAAYSGTAAPDLEFRVSLNGNVTADGTITPGGADFAEMLPAAAGLEPGDVLVVGSDGLLARSSAARQTSVVGVYSTRPGFVGGAEDGEAPEGSVPLAIVGVVPVKASAENGAIAPGDLLVTSSTPGHAMRAGDSPTLGTVIGKALGGLSEGTGTIDMLVTLQ